MHERNSLSDDSQPSTSPASRPRPDSSFRPRHPSFRWHSYSAGRERSLHLVLCRSPQSCSRSVPLPWVDGLPDAGPDLTWLPASMWTDSLEPPSRNDRR